MHFAWYIHQYFLDFCILAGSEPNIQIQIWENPDCRFLNCLDCWPPSIPAQLLLGICVYSAWYFTTLNYNGLFLNLLAQISVFPSVGCISFITSIHIFSNFDFSWEWTQYSNPNLTEPRLAPRPEILTSQIGPQYFGPSDWLPDWTLDWPPDWLPRLAPRLAPRTQIGSQICPQTPDHQTVDPQTIDLQIVARQTVDSHPAHPSNPFV